METLLKKLGIQNLEALKDENGAWEEGKAVNEIKLHLKNIFQQDPEFIEPLKTKISEKLNEEKIVLQKQIKKSFKTLFGVELTNDELSSIAYEDLFKKGLELKSSASSADVQKLQNELIALGQKNQALESEKEQAVSSAKAEFEKEYQAEKIEKELLKAVQETEFVVSKEIAMDILKVNLEKKGIKMVFDRESKKMKFKVGELDALKDDKSAIADMNYFVSTILSDITKKSNGSGGDDKKKIIDTESDYFKNLPDAVKENLTKLRNGYKR